MLVAFLGVSASIQFLLLKKITFQEVSEQKNKMPMPFKVQLEYKLHIFFTHYVEKMM